MQKVLTLKLNETTVNILFVSLENMLQPIWLCTNIQNE